jgi:alpha-beta hydrolase superfamily lysophospholipase
VFVLHGYLDHTGVLYRVIQNCLEQQLVVAVYDLPGHGLSSGERAAIRDFSDYVSVLYDFLELAQGHVPAPYHVLSHSTGGAIVFEYLASTPDQVFEQIVFLAPLVHHAHWLSSKIAYTLGKPFRIDSLPRRYSQENIDPVLAEFIKTDPLQTNRVPLSWVSELFEWDREIQDTVLIESPVLIIQGKKDNVVDWEYNLPFLQEKIPQAHIVLIDKAGHYLINESPEIHAEVFDTINAYLKKSEINFSQN